MGRSKRNRQAKNKGDKIKIADNLFSQVIRLKEMDHSGRIPCYTCGKYYHFNDIQCGHFIKRGNLFTRWLEENAKPQCNKCNVEHDGEYKIFRRNLEYDHPGLPEYLEELGRAVAPTVSSADLDSLIDGLRKRLKFLGGIECVPK